ncbi:hypothetical protein M501DRAFT_1015681 [Patellaria atrata CBS 101060]|uniref:Stc1 domain-containing protein n=1 Tax=Patellaria atrata CBS 101060 TaxID=1346257 RepID=A0A9P4SBH0_9PEZI|nr:hypothetical protein M501DRAFT_1015681 [Patellaria atrata CBS 101060]
MGGRKDKHYSHYKALGAPSPAELARVAIPDRPVLKCFRCEKNKVNSNFSDKQLEGLRIHILENKKKGQHAITHQVNCRACTGQQVCELTCEKCDKTKSLDDFAKAQRSKGEKARCKKCMEAQLNDEPGDINGDTYRNAEEKRFDADWDDSVSSAGSSNFIVNYDSTGSSLTDLSNLSIGDRSSSSSTTGYETDATDASAGAETKYSGYNPAGTSQGKKPATSGSSANSGTWAAAASHNGMPEPNESWNFVSLKTNFGGNTPTVAGSSRYGGSNVEGSVRSARPATNSGGFAKVRAYKVPREPSPPSSSSSSSDEEEDDDPDYDI